MSFVACLTLLFLCWGGCQSSTAVSCHETEPDSSCDPHPSQSPDNRYQTWIYSLLASCVIGLSGIVPLLFIPVETGLKLSQEGGKGNLLRLLLSFAVGGLLGDVFLHLLPEAWDHLNDFGEEESASNHMTLGLWVLFGMFSFTVIEMMFTASEASKSIPSSETGKQVITEKFYSQRQLNTESNHASTNGYTTLNRTDFYDKPIGDNGYHNGHAKSESELNCTLPSKSVDNAPSNIHITGYLNLMANGIDNFTHGLAVAASFLVSCKMGVVTTFAILIHEVPHEIGDFAILLKSGFHPWSAAKAQISTATIGILGVVVALSAESIDRLGVCTSWILPFTAGGFLNIALINVLPDLLKENDPWESMKQFVCLCAGIAIMALVGLLV